MNHIMYESREEAIFNNVVFYVHWRKNLLNFIKYVY